jgi:two-component system response regulator
VSALTPRETVLLVEDSPADVDLMLHALHAYQLPNRVDVVRDGAEALEYLFGTGRYEGRADASGLRLVLLDLKLPLVDGLEVLSRIKMDARTSRLPVVILTSSAEDRDLRAAYRMGVNSFIVKPIDFDQFIESAGRVGVYWLGLNRPDTAAEPEPERVARAGRLRVLIADDSTTDAILVEYELGRAGYAVTTLRVDRADSMRSAMATAEWDLVVSDVAMPGFDALEALRIAREHDRRLPFVVLSGFVGDGTAQALMSAGADDCLAKDDLAMLPPRVAELLAAGPGRNRPFPPPV